MPTLTVQVSTDRSPAEVRRILTDFSSSRAEAWPGVDLSHLQVHDSGDDWIEVTEGNRIGWERERYTWDDAAGTVTATTVDSNLWGPGSGWDYRLVPEGTGTRVEVTLRRTAKNLKGRLIGALFPLIGRRMVTASLNSAVNRS